MMRYTVRFPAPQSHYAEVEMVLPPGQRTLMAAVWTPGSYLLREYARNIEGLTAYDEAGKPVEAVKTSKNRWRLDPRAVRVSYRVYGREMTVRTNFIEGDFAVLNGAPTFLTMPSMLGEPHEISVVTPPGWTSVVTALEKVGDNRFRAADFDELVDSPILCGSPLISRFEVAGKEHVLATWNDGGLWDLPQAARDAEAIVRAHSDFWGGLPYPRYAFLNLLVEARGGLEHKNSTVLMGSRFDGRVREQYVKWLLLVSHEFFHVWNVKRLRPVELDRFDYEAENYTPSLWIAEGFTAYYESVLLRRSGLITDKEFLKEMALTLESVETVPGREVQSVREASWDAWIKFYRPDENSVNSAISYYDKGAAIAFILDMRIRQETDSDKSLDDVMRLANERYGEGKPGYTEEQFIALISEVAGTDLTAFVRRLSATTEPLDYQPALEWLGLKLAPPEAPADGSPEPVWLGAKLKVDSGRLLVAAVPRGTPAFACGLDAEDEILALGDYRVLSDKLDERLKLYRVGDKTSLLVARRGKLVTLEVTFTRKPGAWKLEVDPKAGPAAVARREQWMSGRQAVPAR